MNEYVNCKNSSVFITFEVIYFFTINMQVLSNSKVIVGHLFVLSVNRKSAIAELLASITDQ